MGEPCFTLSYLLGGLVALAGQMIVDPALVLLGFWFAEQVYFGAVGLTSPVGSPGAVAYFAHVGGFLFGLTLSGFSAKHRGTGSPGTPVY